MKFDRNKAIRDSISLKAVQKELELYQLAIRIAQPDSLTRYKILQQAQKQLYMESA